MKHVRDSIVNISTLPLPCEWDSIVNKAGGPRPSKLIPIIREADRAVIAGLELIAWHANQGIDKIAVRVMRGDSRQSNRLRGEYYTGIKSARFYAKLDDAYQWIAENPSSAYERLCRKHEPQVAMRMEMARLTGRTTTALRQLELRERKRSGVNVPRLAPFELETLGVRQPHGFVQKLQGIHARTQRVMQKLADARDLLRSMPPDHPVRGEAVELSRIIATVRAKSPHGVCPSCKNIKGASVECETCDGRGYVGAGEYKDVEPALLDSNQPKVRKGDRLHYTCNVKLRG